MTEVFVGIRRDHDLHGAAVFGVGLHRQTFGAHAAVFFGLPALGGHFFFIEGHHILKRAGRGVHGGAAKRRLIGGVRHQGNVFRRARTILGGLNVDRLVDLLHFIHPLDCPFIGAIAQEFILAGRFEEILDHKIAGLRNPEFALRVEVAQRVHALHVRFVVRGRHAVHGFGADELRAAQTAHHIGWVELGVGLWPFFGRRLGTHGAHLEVFLAAHLDGLHDVLIRSGGAGCAAQHRAEAVDGGALGRRILDILFLEGHGRALGLAGVILAFKRHGELRLIGIQRFQAGGHVGQIDGIGRVVGSAGGRVSRWRRRLRSRWLFRGAGCGLLGRFGRRGLRSAAGRGGRAATARTEHQGGGHDDNDDGGQLLHVLLLLVLK